MKRNLTKSKEYFDIAKRLIPCQTQCLSKGPTQWINNVAPHYLKGGKGCRVWDVDGNEYIDYAMGLGPVVLGYGNESVDNAIKKQLEDGISFTLCHYLEVELAEKLVDILPCAEMVRYGKNGSDVTSAAIKVARSYTGRDKIIACGYHGWQDWYVASTERDRGIPKVMKDLVFTFRYNDIEGLASILDKNKGEISAVIMEPVTAIKPEKGFLEEVKKLTHEAGAILIYDEMFTGFRWSLGGAQEYFNVIPDLACFGKAMANGMPLSTLVGKEELMRELEKVFYSFTFGGEALSLAASIATIKEIEEKNVIEYIWDKGQMMIDDVKKLIEKNGVSSYLDIMGYPPKSIMVFKETGEYTTMEMKTFFQQECIKRGILFIGYHTLSLAHRDSDIKETLAVYDEVMGLFKNAVESGDLKDRLEGPVLTQIFKNVGDRSAGLAKR